MTFNVGQKVMCVDASPPANPWHCAHPLVLHKIYVVHSLTNGLHCIDIDGSGRAWQTWRFRPLVERQTDISIFKKMLAGRGRQARADG